MQKKISYFFLPFQNSAQWICRNSWRLCPDDLTDLTRCIVRNRQRQRRSIGERNFEDDSFRRFGQQVFEHYHHLGTTVEVERES